MSSGKVSAEAKAFAHVRSDLDCRAVPPEVLNEKEKACWQALVRDKPPEWFSSDCLALLEMLVKEIVRSEWLAERTGASQEELHQADLMGDLEEVAQVVHAGRGQAQMTLLLYGCWLGVALRHDDAAQVGAVLARHVLPSFFTDMVAEMDLAVLLAGVQENAPTVVAHLDVAELCPALWVHADSGTQIHIHVGGALGAHVVPPIDEVGLPLLQRTLQGAVFAQVDVVRNFFAVVNTGHECLLVKLNAVEIECGFFAFAIDLQGTLVAYRVRAVEDPVLPS